jgi:hypothetical protein
VSVSVSVRVCLLCVRVWCRAVPCRVSCRCTKSVRTFEVCCLVRAFAHVHGSLGKYRFFGDCSRYLLLSSDMAFNTSELGVSVSSLHSGTSVWRGCGHQLRVLVCRASCSS